MLASSRPPALVHPGARRSPAVVVRAAASTGTAAPAAAIDALKRGVAQPGSVPAPAMLSAMLELERAKLSPEPWLASIEAPRARWRLIFTADSKQVQAGQKKQPSKGGIFFPIPAVQKFDPVTKDFENGVFLGPIASLTFNGPYTMAGRQLSFDVRSMNIGLGPWRWSIALKKDAKPLDQLPDSERKALPFFLYAYADGDIIVARGRSGGLAVWTRTTAEWEMNAGVAQVYK
ncbi:hypothetical protein MNEG_1968 [Monoraphidium neglectum]|uniref:Plastid lipid-associated protein/fibrillin conserved domain-containing protein n=1 Tax=Monoraphidium neglectum TaxID=145388 RepID=A0A0D2MTV4_9CHLO|nr:hypothetical protein MNEG_1968 [Monoraphidium neglectum]KIZ05995.1 hypothetical protein MNEG_1968 [Monoraphidium neglectum]|eukprot:XP_013905014.1 hypothetical protein MNEG_1968 [Monoraphidium neglectum]